MAITEITETGPLQKQLNHAFMVDWINRDLFNRVHNDVNKSFVYYDVNMDFVFASTKEINEEGLRILEEKSSVRFWSKGIV